jgi:hypothetical protein
MAKDEAEPSTSAVAPRLSLNEAVALIVARLPPHDVLAIRTAIGNALVNGQLQDCGFFFDGHRLPAPGTNPDTWRHWLEKGQVAWLTGEVHFPPRFNHRGNLVEPSPIRPLFPRQDMLELFGITEAPAAMDYTEPPPPTAAATDHLSPAAVVVMPTKTWIIAEAQQLKAAGKITKGMSKTELAHLFERRSQDAAKTGQLKKSITFRYIRNQLDAWGIWPISSIK